MGPFRTLAVHGELGNNTYVYKLFSDETLADSLLDRVFKRRFQTWRHTWQAAYPKLLPTPPATWPPFEVPLEPAAMGGLAKCCTQVPWNRQCRAWKRRL